MAKLCQILAIEKGAKQRTNKEGGAVEKRFQKGTLFSGRVKRYTPLDENDTDTQPDEIVKVQHNVDDEVELLKEVMAELWDIVITKDAANQKATSSIMVDGEVLVADIPATSLVFLEKQLDDVQTVINSIPVLDASHVWEYDDNSRLHRSNEIIRNRTKKVTKALVLYPATDKHPAQTQTIQEDVVVGKYSEYLTASMITVSRKKQLLDRVYKLKKAVKEARERANSVVVEEFTGTGDKILSFVFGENLVAN